MSDEVVAVVIAACLSLLGWLCVRIFSPKGKVAWGFSHQHAFFLQNLQPPTLVYTKELWIQNIGRAAVKDVEIVLAASPNHFDIWPQRQFTTAQNPNGNLVVRVDNLNSREHFTISMLQTAVDTPTVTNVRWAGGVGKQRLMAPQQVFSKWVILFSRTLLLFGAFAIFYFIVRIIGGLA